MARRIECLFLAVFLWSVSGVYSQEMRFLGFMGGIAFSWPDEISISGIPEMHWEATFRTGAVAGFGIGWSSRYLSVGIDGLFFQKGCRIKNYYWDDFIGYTYYRLDELSFPVLFKLSLLSGTSPYFLGGYEFSIVLSHRRRRSGDDDAMTKQTKKTDNSLVVGVGFRKKMARNLLFIEGRYHLGLQHLSKDSDFWYFPYRKMRSFVLLIGFSI